jgi:hypothetical protein
VCRSIAKATDARREAGAADDGVVQRFCKFVHDLWRAKCLKPELNLGKDGMPMTMPNANMDDVNVFERRLKDARAKHDAIARKLGKPFRGGHLLR